MRNCFKIATSYFRTEKRIYTNWNFRTFRGIDFGAQINYNFQKYSFIEFAVDE